MLFKDLKIGYSIYVLNRNEVKLTQSKILQFKPPYFDNKIGMTDMVVDVQIEGFSIPYTFRANDEVGYNNDSSIVVSTNLDILLKEVEAVKSQSEQILSQKEIYEQKIENCNKILSEFSPVFKQKQETNARFEKLEGSVSKIEEMVTSLVKELKGK